MILQVLLIILYLAHGISCSLDLNKYYFNQDEVTVILEKLSANSNTQEKVDIADRYKCFQPLNCQINQDHQLLYYIYPPLVILDNNQNLVYSTKSMISHEYSQILSTISSSNRATLDPNKACFFVASIDVAWLHDANSSLLSQIYTNLPYWSFVDDDKKGSNHMIISLDPTFNLDKLLSSIDYAILVANNHNTWTFRPQLDLSIPVIQDEEDVQDKDRREYKLLFTQSSSASEIQKQSLNDIKTQLNDQFLNIGIECGDNIISSNSRDKKCRHSDNNSLEEFDATTCRCSMEETVEEFAFPEILSSSQYCLIVHVSDRRPLGELANYLLIQSLKRGCVPIVSSNLKLPFETLLDWPKVSIRLTNEVTFANIVELISSIDDSTYQSMSKQAKKVWHEHLRSGHQIANLLILHYDNLIYPKVLLNASSCHQ